MKLVDELIGRMNAADKRAGQLAKNEQQAMARRAVYDHLQHTLDGMAADGVLDRGEVEKLMQMYRDAGLPTEVLQDLVLQMANGDSVQADPEVLSKLEEGIRFAKSSVESGPMFEFQVQQLMSEHQNASDLASRVLKAEHEMYMAVVRNLKA